MKTSTQSTETRTQHLLRRLITEKQAIKQQMRRDYKNDPAIRQALEKLDKLNNSADV